MGKPYYTLEEVIEWDKVLYQLASYEVSKGMLSIPSSIDEVISTAKQTATTFNYFKRLIQNGECSFEYIYNSVIMRNGPFSQHPSDNMMNSPLPENMSTPLKNIFAPEQDEESYHIQQFVQAISKGFGVELKPLKPDDMPNKKNKSSLSQKKIDKPTLKKTKKTIQSNIKNEFTKKRRIRKKNPKDRSDSK